jgi:beta-glucosidase/6-phospho-beta-glucosidase/beta-galactosidase
VESTRNESIFPTFFIGGFECSTFLWKDQGRRDLASETRHYDCADQDYEILAKHGFGVAREGIPWPMVDLGHGYDFTIIEPLIAAQRKHKVIPIWDLFHYGYPEHLDPFADDFAEHFASYCRAAAEHVGRDHRGPIFFTPINEMTFFGFAAGEWGWAAPFGKSKEDRYRLRLALTKASIAGAKAIKEVLPEARMVTVDPLIVVVPPEDRPDLADEAEKEMFEDTFFCWDVVAGLRNPELGGSPELLDIVGVNCYSFGQMEFRDKGPHQALGPRDPRIRPLCDLLRIVWERYQRPIIIAETSGMGDGRAAWLKDVMEECLAGVREGIELHGVCLFPTVDMPDWHKGNWLHNGFCDLIEPELSRVPFQPYVDELRRWQKLLNRVTELDEDPLSDPVDLNDIKRAAQEKAYLSDQNWS